MTSQLPLLERSLLTVNCRYVNEGQNGPAVCRDRVEFLIEVLGR